MKKMLWLMIMLLLISACGLKRKEDKTPSPFTPTARYEYTVLMGVALITTEAVGNIPPRTPVRVQGMRYDGSRWLYQIVTADGKRGAEARENQLTYAPGVTPYMPTPTSPYFNAAGFVFVTVEQLGDIPPDTSVAIGSSRVDEKGWLYQVYTEDGRVAEAREDQIFWAADITPNAATPTSPFQGEGTIFITKEQLGEIPANTSVGIGSSWFDGRQWRYQIYTEDFSLSAEAKEDQLAYAPDITPGATVPPMKFQGSGYILITKEQVGEIPPNTSVALGSARFNGREWIYQIYTQDGLKTADARESQLAYAPDITPGAPTPVPKFES